MIEQRSITNALLLHFQFSLLETSSNHFNNPKSLEMTVFIYLFIFKLYVERTSFLPPSLTSFRLKF